MASMVIVVVFVSVEIPSISSYTVKGSGNDSGGDLMRGSGCTRFETTTEASETQVTEAINKISSLIKNSSKFRKASKLAIQLI